MCHHLFPCLLQIPRMAIDVSRMIRHSRYFTPNLKPVSLPIAATENSCVLQRFLLPTSGTETARVDKCLPLAAFSKATDAQLDEEIKLHFSLKVLTTRQIILSADIFCFVLFKICNFFVLFYQVD